MFYFKNAKNLMKNIKTFLLASLKKYIKLVKTFTL